MKIKFWGVRGSIPVPGKSTVKYGGNTPCVQLKFDDADIIIDAGTGLRELGNYLIQNPKAGRQINLLISHTHWDHIQGIPFFLPLFRNEFGVKIFTNTFPHNEVSFFIDAQMNPNFFPVSKEIFNASIDFISISENSSFNIKDIRISTLQVNHSQGTLAFKFSKGNKSLVYMTDNEIRFNLKDNSFTDEGLYELNNSLIEFCRDADILIHDCMYNKDSMINKIGWGHSNNISATHFSILAGVKTLVLFHYDPDFADSMIDELPVEALKIISEKKSNLNCIASFEGMELEIDI